jgi:hypothetical protein
MVLITIYLLVDPLYFLDKNEVKDVFLEICSEKKIDLK